MATTVRKSTSSTKSKTSSTSGGRRTTKKKAVSKKRASRAKDSDAVEAKKDTSKINPKKNGAELPSVGRPRKKKAAPEDVSGDPTRLSEVQKAVLKDVRAKAKTRSDGARANLLDKAKKSGYSEAQVDQVLEYIKKDAPLVISFNPDKSLHIYGGGDKFPTVKVDRTKLLLIDSFLVDTEYRNQFETGISSGATAPHSGGCRDGWEKTIFEGGYHKGGVFVPSERPKYGAMNAHKLQGGPAPSYGNCFLLLKEGARGRATFTPSNSSGCNAKQVGTIDHFQHVLAASSHFNAIMQVGLGKTEHSSGSYYPYIEMQVHGPVEFAKDIKELVIAKNHKGTDYEKKMLQFAKKNDIPVSYHD